MGVKPGAPLSGHRQTAICHTVLDDEDRVRGQAKPTALQASGLSPPSPPSRQTHSKRQSPWSPHAERCPATMLRWKLALIHKRPLRTVHSHNMHWASARHQVLIQAQQQAALRCLELLAWGAGRELTVLGLPCVVPTSRQQGSSPSSSPSSLLSSPSRQEAHLALPSGQAGDSAYPRIPDVPSSPTHQET